MKLTDQITLGIWTYRVSAWIILISPIGLISIPGLPYRFEILAALYLLLSITFLLKAYWLGGRLDQQLSHQINTSYGLSLKSVKQRYIDLHLLTLVKIFDVWLVFPAAWSDKILMPGQRYLAYQLGIENWLKEQRQLPPHNEDLN